MSKIPSILIIGKNGQVGWELCRTMAALGNLTCVDYPEIDLSNPDSIKTVIREVKPDIVVNAAAYTAVDKAESEALLAAAINSKAPEVIADEAKKLGSILIHYSTDYVYDGGKKSPYTENDSTNPINVYGRTKLEGDKAILSSGVPSIILRTSWIYGWRGNNFLLTILGLLREKKELNVINDQHGAPTWSHFIAEITAQIIAQGGDDIRNYIGEKSGIYHMTPSGSTTWHGFAKVIAENDPSKMEHVCKAIRPMNASDYSTIAARPANSILGHSKFEATFNLSLPKWDMPLKNIKNWNQFRERN